MAYPVIWLHTATDSFNEIYDFLILTWNQAVATKFLGLVEECIDTLSDNPELYSSSADFPQFRKRVLHKNIILYYRIIPEPQSVQLVYFFDTRQNPDKLKL